RHSLQAGAGHLGLPHLPLSGGPGRPGRRPLASWAGLSPHAPHASRAGFAFIYANIAILFRVSVVRPWQEAPPGGPSGGRSAMALTPLEIQRMRFPQRMRGCDPGEVEAFLALVAEELAGRLAQAEKLERENRYYRQRLEEAEGREHQLQQTL